MNVRLPLACCVLSAGLLLTQAGWAQTTDAETQAAQRVLEGQALAKQGKWEQARLLFVQAYAVHPTSVLLWDLALTELKSSHAVEAAQHFQRYKKHPSAEPEKLAALPKYLDRAYAQSARIKVDAPATATVAVDGSRSDWSPDEPLVVPPGEHTLSIRVGDHSHEKHVEARAGEETTVAFAVLSSNAGSTNAAPGMPAAASPQPAVDSIPGRGTSDVPGSGHDQGSAKGWVVGGLAAAGAVTLAFGAGFGAAAQSDQARVDDFRASRPSGSCYASGSVECADWRQAADDERSHARVANVLFGVSGALLVGSAVAWLAWPKSEAAAGVALSPGGAAIRWSSTF
jgi:hypothetical protein